MQHLLRDSERDDFGGVLTDSVVQAVPQATSELARAARTDPLLSQLPAHLELRRVLGQGGSSVVYEAFHTRLRVPVAVKLLAVQGAHAEQARQRMRREAELYALLDDPRIPRVYDVNELPDGTPYVVMEMVPGQSLEQRLAQAGALDAKLAVSIACQVLLVLESVHARGVLHRDVKPANVILTAPVPGGCQLRLVDFGIAKLSGAGSPEEAVTQRGALVGTPHYMTPERLTGQVADASTDVYAVGVMLYEMLCGVVPFDGPNLGCIMAAVLRERPKALRERGVRISPELEQLVMKAMAREPALRFSSASEMLGALALVDQPEPAARALGRAEPGAAPFPPGQPARRARRLRQAFFACVFCVLFIGAGFLLGDLNVEPAAKAPPSQVAAQPALPPPESIRREPPAALLPVFKRELRELTAAPPAPAPKQRSTRRSSASERRRQAREPVEPPALQPAGPLPINPY